MFPYLPHTDQDREKLKTEIGIDSVAELYSDIPGEVLLDQKLDLNSALSEIEIKKRMKEISSKHKDLNDYTSFLGAGVYDHYIPATVNHIISRSEFYTAYTPYQAEISQGYLQAIFEYQTMICELSGLNVANASMYDGASAIAEAALMSTAINRRRQEIIVSSTVSPESRKVLKTYCKAADFKLREVAYENGLTDQNQLADIVSEDTAGVIIQSPNFFGQIEYLSKLSEIINKAGAVFIVAADPIFLALLEAPGNLGAEIVVGEGQSLGNPHNFGGPHFGFFATTEDNMRKLPGRVIGETEDEDGNRGFVMTLQTREQHIRRKRATSNICSNQALNALAATVYLSLMGKKGLKEVANRCVKKAHYAAEKITELKDYELAFSGSFFKEFTISTDRDVSEINEFLKEKKFIGGYDLGQDYSELHNNMLLAVTEKRTKSEIDDLVQLLEEIK